MRLLLLALCFAFGAQAEDFRVCESATLPEGLPTESFKHKRGKLVSMFRAHHSANDAIAVLGEAALLEGKFSYGLMAKDLKDEVVEIWIDNCGSRYTLIHRGTTDSHGRLSWILPAGLLNRYGQYRIWMRVVGDGTSASATIRLLPAGSKIAVFDIDGTLTSSESDVTLEAISDLIGGTFSPPTRDHAVELTKFLHDKLNYQIVYLSGRHHFLNGISRTWLSNHDFAPGTLLVAHSIFEIFPNCKSVGGFKHKKIDQLKAGGLQIERAYGNSLTDVFAYKQAGISLERIYIVGKFSGITDGIPLGSNFTKHYQELVNGENVSPE